MDRRGSVCEKHGEYSATGICRWCDPVKASSPPATGMLPASKNGALCTMMMVHNGPPCAAPATWRWNKDGDEGRIFFCEAHHEARSRWFPDWRQERIAPVASEGPKAASLSEIYRGKP